MNRNLGQNPEKENRPQITSQNGNQKIIPSMLKCTDVGQKANKIRKARRMKVRS